MSEELHPTVFEAEDALPARRILGIALCVVAFGTLLCFITAFLLRVRELDLRPSMRFPEKALPPPHVVANVRQEPFEIPQARPSLRELDETELESWGYVDRERGIVQIPIDRAMDLVANPESR